MSSKTLLPKLVLSVFSTNIEGLTKDKLGELTHHARLEMPHVISLQETWLRSTQTDSEVSIAGYTIFRRDRMDGKHGGVLTYVRSDLCAATVNNCVTPEVNEAIWLRIPSYKRTLYVANVYHPPTNDTSVFNNLAKDIELIQALKDNPVILITGDLNCHHPTWLGSKDCHGNEKTNDAGINCFEMCQTLGLSNMIKGNTFFRNKGDAISVLDLAITDNPSLICNVALSNPVGISPHASVSLRVNLVPKSSKFYTKTSWKYHRANWNDLKNDLSSCDWSPGSDVNETWSKFKSNILSAMKRNIPQNAIKRCIKDQPWFTDQCAIACSKKEKLWRKFQKTRNQYDKDNYKQQVNFCKEVYKEAQSYYKVSVNKKLADENTSAKEWWRIVNYVVGEGCHTEIPALFKDKVYFDDAKEKAELFKNIFVEKATIDDNGVLPKLLSSKSPKSLTRVKIRARCVLRKLMKLNISKATGPDGIPARVLKECASVLYKPLTSLFTFSLKTSIVPDDWKCANVVPIYKSGGKCDPNNYRPISLLSIISKVMESIINDYLSKHIFGLKLISQHQYGFRAKHSTLDLLTSTTQRWTNALDKGSEVKAVALDISRAFDRVWHNGLLSKLMSFGIGGQVYRWIRSFLSGRSIRVVINGHESSIGKTNAGVPQGSILGPTLFLIFINDLSEVITNRIDMFADDTTLSAVIPSASCRPEVNRSIQSDLINIESWARDWLVVFNSKKTQVMTISRKRDNFTIPLYFLGEELSETDNIKLVGVTITSKLSWGEHVDKIAKHAGQRLGIIRKAITFSPYMQLVVFISQKFVQ